MIDTVVFKETTVDKLAKKIKEFFNKPGIEVLHVSHSTGKTPFGVDKVTAIIVYKHGRSAVGKR